MAHNYFLLKESLSLVKMNKNEEALKIIDKLIEDQPNNNAAWYLKGIIYGKLDDFDEGNKAFEKASDLKHLKKKMDCTEILEQLDILNNAGKFPYNIEVLLLHLRGRVLEHLRIYEDFLPLFQDHLKLLEEAVEYHENVGEDDFLGYRLIWEKMTSFLDSLNMENESIMLSNKNLKEGENDSLLLHNYSLDQFNLFDQIIKWFKFLMEECGIKSACLFNNLGVSLVKRSFVKQIAESNPISYFKKALTIDKDYYFSLNNLGVCENSVSFFDEVLKIDDMNIAACYNKAWGLIQNDSENLEEFEEALKYCEIVLNKKPEDGECWHLHGRILEILGNRELALESYKKSLIITPESEDLVEDLGKLLIQMENYSEAIKVFEDATKL